MSLPAKKVAAPAFRTAPRASDRVCTVCAKPAVGFGVAYKYEQEIHWCCGSASCFDIAARTFKMTQREFGRLDQIATIKAGEVAGEYLDSIGKTDLATMTEAEWAQFLFTVVGEYRFALHETLRGESPF